MQKFSFIVRTAAMAAVFALIAGSSLQAQEEGGRGGRGGGQRGQRGGGGGGGGQRGQRGGGGFGGQRGGGGFGGQRGGFGGPRTATARTMSKAALLGMEEVQKELKLEGDDLETVTAAVDGYNEERRSFSDRGRGGRSSFDRGAFQEMSDDERSEAIKKMTEEREKAAAETAKKMKKLNKETDEILAALLDEKQWKRLEEIQVQSTLQNGLVAAMMDEDFAAKMKLSKEQAGKLEEIKKADEKAAKEVSDKMREMFSGGFDRSKFGELQAMRAEASEKSDERTKKAKETVEGMMTDEQKKSLEEMKGKAFTFPERRGRGGAGGRGQRGGGGGGQRGGRGGRGGGGGEGGGGGRPNRPGGDDGGGAI